jgi:PAS domain S-box
VARTVRRSRQTRKITYSPSFCKLLGYETKKEFANSRTAWEDLVHPEDAARVAKYHARIIKADPKGPDFDIEYRMLTKRGYRWFHDTAKCIRRPDGSVSDQYGFIFDIDEHVITDEINRQVIEDYFAVSVADLDEKTIRTIKKSPYFAHYTPETVHPYTESLLELSSLVPDKSGDLFKRIADPACVTREFGSETNSPSPSAPKAPESKAAGSQLPPTSLHDIRTAPSKDLPSTSP